MHLYSRHKYNKIYILQFCIDSAMGGLEKRKANQDRPIFLPSTTISTLFTIFTYFVKFKNVGIDSS